MIAEQFIPEDSTEPSFRPVMSESRVRADMLSDSGTGFCIRCGDFFPGYQPDARRLPCPSCRQPGVHGLEELISMDQIRITEDPE